ncbi:MAG: hypothetical protein AAFP90_02145 [Planctomycetota bacterium]
MSLSSPLLIVLQAMSVLPIMLNLGLLIVALTTRSEIRKYRMLTIVGILLLTFVMVSSASMTLITSIIPIDNPRYVILPLSAINMIVHSIGIACIAIAAIFGNRKTPSQSSRPTGMGGRMDDTNPYAVAPPIE